MPTPPVADFDSVRADMARWLERAVIGLNLCPFAKAVWVRGQVHTVVYGTDAEAPLLDALVAEAEALAACDAAERDTTLLVAPYAPADFFHFHAWVQQGERRLRRAGFEGRLQLAHFHPQFEFADAEPGDAANRSNRAPHPTLHLLREASVAQAVAAFPDASAIYARNINTLRALGDAGWAALQAGQGVR